MGVGLVGDEGADIGSYREVLVEVNLDVSPEVVLVVLFNRVIESGSLGPCSE